MRKTLSLLAALLAVACGGDEQTDTSALQPTITQQEANARYRVKAGHELLIAPSYTNAEGARFTWTCDDEVVCREASYVFRRDKAGIYYLSLRVENDYGAAEDELRVRVDALEAPCITLIEPVGGFTVAADAELTIAPTVENGQTARFRWTIDGETVGEAAEYLFRRHECGDYEVTFSAANDDGEDSVSFTVKVLSPEQMPFSWEFPQTVYNVALGRTIRLKGWNPVNAFDAEYIWEVDGTERQRGAQLEYRFEALEEGPHEVTVTMRNSYATRSQTLSVNVCAAEGTYYRPADAASRASTVRVFEYLPAPGLWVSGYMYGPLFTATTMAEACAYVQSRFDINYMISLGAWGGYVVAGFDHSVDNSGGGVDFAQFADRARAILMAWYPGQEGGRAVAEILTGAVAPSGKLPISIELRAEDYPFYGSYYENVDRSHRKGAPQPRVNYDEGIFVGYRGYDRTATEPLYAFGYGLSYTTFAYSGLKVARQDDGSCRVSFDVRNTGRRDGAEVAQLYVSDLAASVPRPVKELKGYEKVFLKRGETKRVEILLPHDAFAFYDTVRHDFVVEPGDFLIQVGASSRDLRLKGTIRVD